MIRARRAPPRMGCRASCARASSTTAAGIAGLDDVAGDAILGLF